MAIYKQDKVVINGVATGEQVDGQADLRMPYRIAQSISDGGHTYTFSHMDKGEAVYKRGDIARTPPVSLPEAPMVEATDNANVLSELPKGAVLDADFVGGRKTIRGAAYRLYEPVSKIDGKFVYVPA